MIPEIGHFALILALSLAICQGVSATDWCTRTMPAMMECCVDLRRWDNSYSLQSRLAV